MSECKTIAVCNQKGGVGKTTTAVNLGAGLVRAGRRVLLVDCDPQGDLTQSLGYQADELDQSLGRHMYMATQDCKPVVGDTILHHEEGIDLLPSNLDLSSMESQLVNAMSREKLLSLLLRDVKKDYDYILLDCSPSLGMITINALTAADSVIIPVQTQYLPAKGMTQLLRSINMVRTHTNEHLTIGGIVMTLVDGRTNLAKEVINTIRTNYGMSIKIFDMTMFTRHMSLVSYLQQVQIALIMIRRLMESQLSKRSIDLWIVAASVKWMLLFIKDGEKVIR